MVKRPMPKMTSEEEELLGNQKFNAKPFKPNLRTRSKYYI